MTSSPSNTLGQVALIGSGETAANGGRAFEVLVSALPVPLEIAVLETPAGFELNSDRVAGRVVDFMSVRLQNYRPQIALIPARRRQPPFSTDDTAILAPLSHSHLIYMGAGSPSYTVRQLSGSLAWHMILGRHLLGASLALASAATIALGAWALPVYEIYKVGEDPHWKPGLNFFGRFGLSLAVIPHWNNTDGGAELDTSCCFMGRQRLDLLAAMLPAEATILGIDEHTTLLFDLSAGQGRVLGTSAVHIRRAGQERTFESGESFPLTELGPFKLPVNPWADLPAEIRPIFESARQERQQQQCLNETPPPEALALLEARQQARSRREWSLADSYRAQLAALGWQVQDTPTGPRLEPLRSSSDSCRSS